VTPSNAPAQRGGEVKIQLRSAEQLLDTRTWAATAQSVPRIAPVRASRAIDLGSLNPLRLLHLLVL